ncbi:MAG: DUF4419 domain-containing protein [Prevotella sp.]|nr:DUF4419 domain-containing protein [Prevotella sp.]
MKKSFIIIVLALIASLATAQTKFTVDEDLPAPKQTITKYNDKFIIAQIINTLGVSQEDYRVLKTSFEGQQLAHIGKDNFFKCIVQAYADHRPLVLSPDMVWLVISQGFSRYVNAHAEEMRDLLVFHEGKMELVTLSNNNIFSPSADWELLLNDFSTCIANNTKGELADLMTADFTTTGITERIASQISLMDVVKHYFIYTRISAACGIPSITLKGSPFDWQKVLDKARCLRKYNLEKWSDDLVAILKEFVEASKGNPNQKFWQGIVNKKRVDQLKTDNSCDPDPAKMTKLDGWFLKFFPNNQGETPDKVEWNHDMPSEMVHVNFRQVLTDPATGVPLDTIPIQLWAGFVGIEEDAKTYALTPKIGWLARIGDEESDELGRYKELNKYGGNINIDLSRGQEVPVALSKMEHIRTLHLHFWHSPVVIPEWLDKIPIDELHIMGEFTDEKEAQLRQRLPNVIIERVDNIVKSLKPLPADQKTEKPPKPKKMKAGDRISGTVSDELGPLVGATVMEVDEEGRNVGYATTDINGQFKLKIVNPRHLISVSYVGLKTVTLLIKSEPYNVMMQPSTTLERVPINSQIRVY